MNHLEKRTYTITIDFEAVSDDYAREIKEKITYFLWNKFPYSMSCPMEIRWETETWADMTLRAIEERKKQASS